MGIFTNDEPPPLYVPDLTKPAGAEVAADGTVACVACGTRLPMARMDVVGQGYRCPPCTGKAEINALAHGSSDVAANLSVSDRNSLRTSGAKMLIPGVAMIIGGVCLFPFLRRAPFYLIAAGIGYCGIGLTRMKTAA